MDEQRNRGASAAAEGPKNPRATPFWRAIEDEFLTTGDASRVAAKLTRARDELVLEAYRAVIEPALPKSAAMLAAGAYARGDTFPYSEMEVLLVAESGKQSETLNELLPVFVRRLWKEGLRVNSGVLPVAECVDSFRRDSALGLGLLNRRFLAGDRTLYETLEEKLPSALESQAEKISQQLCQRARARHARFRNTVHHAGPDVKEGPGGLEDVRLIGWLSTLKSEQDAPQRDLSDAVALVSRARCFLHFSAGTDHNILDSEAQRSLERQPFVHGKSSSDWMREYFQSAHAIFNEARRALEGAEKSRSSLLENFREYRSRLSNLEFTVSRDRLFLRNPGQLATDPPLVFRTLEFIARHGVLPATETERRLEAAREVLAHYCAQPRPLWPSLKAVLACPQAVMALRAAEAAGLMPAIFPEWRAIEHLVPNDPEFRYTVEEHTLLAMELVLELASGANPERRRFQGLLSEVDDAALLLFALLFHEIGHGGDDPLRLAEGRARQAMERIEMPENARSTAEFLIRHQFDVSDAMSGRDIEDPATARLLAERVGTIERLKMLTVMAYARIVALGEESKVPWRLEQLWRAYEAAQHELIRAMETDRIQRAPENLPGDTEFLKGFPSRYLRARAPAEIEGHLQLFERSRPTGVAVRLDEMEGAYRVTVVARDRPFLFASFAGAISSFGLDILKAEAFSNAQGIVLDTFVFADPKRMLQQNPTEADRLSDLLRRIALGKTDAQRLMRGHRLPDSGKWATPPKVQFDSEACPTATLVEIETEDRPGLLYSLAAMFSSNACNIDVVLVDTKGRRAIDVFYVAQDGRKLSPEMQASLKVKLLAAC